MYEKQIETLAAIVHWFKCIQYETVYPHTTLNHDLKLWGIDFDEFLLAFTAHFGLDAEAFPYDRFFVDVIGPKYWYYKWFRPEALHRPPLTIWDLSSWVVTGTFPK